MNVKIKEVNAGACTSFLVGKLLDLAHNCIG